MSPHNSDDKFPTFRRIAVKSKIVMKKIGKVLLVLLIILALAHGIVSAIAGHQLEAKLQDLKAKGEPIAVAELEKPKVPDSENAAPIYAKAFDILAKIDSKELETAVSLLRPKEREKNPGLWDESAKTIAKCDRIFLLVEEATSKPQCQFQTKWEEGFSEFPQLMQFRKISGLLAARALLQARNGDTAGALHSVEQGIKVGKSVSNEPTLRAQVINMTLLREESSALRQILSSNSISEAQARQMYDNLGGFDLMKSYHRTMQTHRTVGIWAFDHLRKHPENLKIVVGYVWGGDERTAYWLFISLRFLWRPLSYVDELAYLRSTDKLIAISDQPYRNTTPGWSMNDVQHLVPGYAILSRTLVWVFYPAGMMRDNTIAELSGSQILMALTACKNRNGTYPASLAELRSKLGWKIPEDPFSGKDFIYKRQGQGFLLYSLGSNLKDNGARILDRQIAGPKGPYPPTIRDIETTGQLPYRTLNGGYADDIIWQMKR